MNVSKVDRFCVNEPRTPLLPAGRVGVLLMIFRFDVIPRRGRLADGGEGEISQSSRSGALMRLVFVGRRGRVVARRSACLAETLRCENGDYERRSAPICVEFTHVCALHSPGSETCVARAGAGQRVVFAASGTGVGSAAHCGVLRTIRRTRTTRPRALVQETQGLPQNTQNPHYGRFGPASTGLGSFRRHPMGSQKAAEMAGPPPRPLGLNWRFRRVFEPQGRPPKCAELSRSR